MAEKTNKKDLIDSNVDEMDIAAELEETHAKFTCPNCGEIERDDVVFLCNTCDSSEVIHKDGIYMCPSCLNPGKNFQCMHCDSKEVQVDFFEE